MIGSLRAGGAGTCEIRAHKNSVIKATQTHSTAVSICQHVTASTRLPVTSFSQSPSISVPPKLAVSPHRQVLCPSSYLPLAQSVLFDLCCNFQIPAAIARCVMSPRFVPTSIGARRVAPSQALQTSIMHVVLNREKTTRYSMFDTKTPHSTHT